MLLGRRESRRLQVTCTLLTLLPVLGCTGDEDSFSVGYEGEYVQVDVNDQSFTCAGNLQLLDEQVGALENFWGAPSRPRFASHGVVIRRQGVLGSGATMMGSLVGDTQLCRMRSCMLTLTKSSLLQISHRF